MMSNRRILRHSIRSHVRTFTLTEMQRGEKEQIVQTGLTRPEVRKILMSLRNQGLDVNVRDGIFMVDGIEQTFYIRPEQ